MVVTGSSTTMSTASRAPWMPPGKSATSNASCSSTGASGSGASAATGSGWSLIGALLGCGPAVVVRSVVAPVDRWRFVELVVDLDLALLRAGPAHGELGEGLGLLEPDGRLAEQLEQREEAGDDHEGGVRIRDQAAERRDPFPAQPFTQDAGLLAHAHRRRVQVGQPDHRSLLGHHR